MYQVDTAEALTRLIVSRETRSGIQSIDDRNRFIDPGAALNLLHLGLHFAEMRRGDEAIPR